MATRDDRKRKSREAIRQAFSDLLCEKDLSRITVKEIAERADLDRKTFYLHYESVDALVDEMTHDEIEKRLSTLDGQALGADGVIDIKRLFIALEKELAAGLDRGRCILRHVDLDALINRLSPMLAKELVARDSFGLANDLGPYLETFASFFCAGLLSIYRQWAMTEEDLPLEVLAELTGAALAGGVSSLAEKAREMNLCS